MLFLSLVQGSILHDVYLQVRVFCVAGGGWRALAVCFSRNCHATAEHANKINMITMRSVALLIFSRSSHSFIINQTRHHRSIFTPPILPPLCFTHKMSTQKDATTDAVSLISPPMAKREEDRVVFAGIAPPGWDSKMPRQSNDSSGEYT